MERGVKMPLVKSLNICMDITDEDISVELIETFLGLHKSVVADRNTVLDNYYAGEQSILNRVIEDTEKPNNKPVTNFCSYITDTLTGFFVGKPPTYTSIDKEYLGILTEIFNNNNEQEENHDLAEKGSIKGQGFELLYVNEDGEIFFNCLDTDTVIMVYDTTIKNDPVMAMRYYTIHNYITLVDIIKIDLYTKTHIHHYTQAEGNTVLDNIEEHFFGIVPIVEYANNRHRRGDFENIISLQDMFNFNTANIANDIDYFSNCYLGISGAEGTTKEDISVIKSERTIIFPVGGDAKFITKNIQDASVQHHRENLSEDIHKTSYTPDLSKEINSNVSAPALKTKMFTTSDIIVSKERKFKTGIQTRIKLITNILNLKGYINKDGINIKTHDYDYKDIAIKFHRNLPTGLYEDADSISKMATAVSKKTLLTEIGIEDVQAEIEQIELEQNANVDLENLHDTEIPTDPTVPVDSGIVAQAEEVASKSLNGAQTSSLMAVLSQYSAKTLTLGQAVNVISISIGVSKEEATKIIEGAN